MAVTEIWVSPTGSDANPGTKALPMATPWGGIVKACPSTGCPGTARTIYLMGGTYKLTASIAIGSSKNGKADSTMNLFAAPNEKPVIDASGIPAGSEARGIQLNASYWHIKGLEIKGAPDNGIIVQGGHDTIENVVAHGNGDTGIQIGASGDNTDRGTYNLILNCDSYENVDTATNGENADGFGAKENVGANNTFRGCRAWNNADDGYDFYAWTSPITLENCWSWSNATGHKLSASDGNGFKLGGDGKGGNHKLTNGIAVSNRLWGFTNNSGANSTCTGCEACSNGSGTSQGVSGVGSSGCPSTSQLAANRAADGSLPSL